MKPTNLPPKPWSTGWEDKEPAPIEFLHSEMMDGFHELRKAKGGGTDVLINGIELTQIIAAAKRATYEKYAKLNLKAAIPKSAL